MQLPSDEQQVALIRAMADGDPEAVGRFATLVGPWVSAALRRMLDDDDAIRDLTDSTFLEIWQTAPLWDRHVGRPLLWALAIARAFAVELLDDRRRARIDGAGSEPPADPARDEQSAVGAVLAADPDGRAILEAAWFSHPVDATSTALPGADALTPPLESFSRRLRGGDGS